MSRSISRSPRHSPTDGANMDVDKTVSPPLKPLTNDKPDLKVVIVTNLTRNVVESHLQTIFGFYGQIAKVDLPLFGKSGQNRGKAALEFSDAISAQQAASHMDGGQLDGAILKVELSDLPIRTRSRSPRRAPPLPTKNGRDRDRFERGRSRSRSPSRSRSHSRTRSRSPIVNPMDVVEVDKDAMSIVLLGTLEVARAHHRGVQMIGLDQGGGPQAILGEVMAVCAASPDPEAIACVQAVRGHDHILVRDLVHVLLRILPIPETAGARVAQSLSVEGGEVIAVMILGIVDQGLHMNYDLQYVH
ncbi:hypothetical protein APHAL10511_002152 [Amanita phalloides]|nr:hypothetical protein APHAL10511_002152 [Amanita phalloides]